jgi:hypothetical protein
MVQLAAKLQALEERVNHPSSTSAVRAPSPKPAQYRPSSAAHASSKPVDARPGRLSEDPSR